MNIRKLSLPRYSTTHTALQGLMEALDGPAIARAGSGVLYGYQASPPLPDVRGAGKIRHRVTAPPRIDRWPFPGQDFPLMQRVKHMFDPQAVIESGSVLWAYLTGRKPGISISASTADCA